MDTLCVIPYKYIPHKTRRKDPGAGTRVQISTTCYKSHIEGGNDLTLTSEIQQTTPNIQNLEDESQVTELAVDDTPVHDSLSSNQGRLATS